MSTFGPEAGAAPLDSPQTAGKIWWASLPLRALNFKRESGGAGENRGFRGSGGRGPVATPTGVGRGAPLGASRGGGSCRRKMWDGRRRRGWVADAQIWGGRVLATAVLRCGCIREAYPRKRVSWSLLFIRSDRVSSPDITVQHPLEVNNHSQDYTCRDSHNVYAHGKKLQ